MEGDWRKDEIRAPEKPCHPVDFPPTLKPMITVIDYKVVNLGSIVNMLKHVGAKNIQVAETPKDLEQATKIILPGVGAFDKAMSRLKSDGWVTPLREKILDGKCPALGICLGMQLMTLGSEEGQEEGLGLVQAKTKRFPKDLRSGDKKLKIPHMGWNQVQAKKQTPLSSDLPEDTRFYFVHSYYVECENPEDVLFKTNYGLQFDSGFASQHIYGMQVHPEKSHRFGKTMMKRFVDQVAQV